MLRPCPVRSFGFATSLAFACTLATAQTVVPKPASNLPPTAPTSAAAAQTVPLSATPTQPDAATKAHRAEVHYDAGLISVNANNSSLNQILREISRQTGMKITGGVKEERVFGHYGPATPDVILATLIDGTTTNMVLLQTAANTPEELILTPRAGGASPPNPNAPGFDDGGSGDDDDRDRARSQPAQTQVQPVGTNPASGPQSIPQPANNVNGSPSNTSPTAATLPVTDSVPIDAIPTPSTTPPANGIVDAPNPPDPGTVNPVTTNPPVNPNPPATDSTTPGTDSSTPNGPKTAQDYALELQKLQQQQQQPKPTTITPQ
jgi:hypothetical protein